MHDQTELPEGDILVHAGDMTSTGTLGQIHEFNNWLGTLSFSNIICVPGNHDRAFEREFSNARKIMTNCHVLVDEEIVIDGVKFYGSPWQPFFCNWSFNLTRGKELANKWKMIPEDTDVLITHSPPFGIHDATAIEQCGCVDLLERVSEVRPKVHIFGHIHESYGRSEVSGIKFINASICNGYYEPINKPIIVEYSK
jgi:Icc-related predicted phosphoesterase